MPIFKISLQYTLACSVLKEGRRKLKIGREKPMTRMTRDPFMGQKVKGQGHQAN